MSSDDLHLDGPPFRKGETVGLREPAGSAAAGEAAVRSTKVNREMIDGIAEWQQWRQQAREIRTYAIDHLEELLAQFEQNATAHGTTVLRAADARQASRMVLDIAREHGVKTLVKGKSMVSEEIGLNETLQAAGIRPIETDLGEYLVQLAGQRPTHIVTPALHLSAEDVGRLYAEKLGEPFTTNHEELTAVARRHLRQEFLSAEMGTSGVNFAVAETGTITIIENEGNVGLSTSVPPVHVALMGMERIVSGMDDLAAMLKMIARIGTSQKLTTYTHLIHGPVAGRKLYVIIVDNGRSRILADSVLRESLRCIRCGMCLNVCPVFQRACGWAYGWVYSGPIGSVITPQFVGLDQAGMLPFASSLCGACREICPVKIDLPHLLVHLRHRAVEEPSPARSLVERITWRAWSWAMSGPRRYALAMRMVRLGVRMATWLPWHPGKLGSWTRGRELPESGGLPFRKRWRGR